MRPDWNEYFMIIAKIVSSRSTCNSRPIGCVLVRDKQILSTGYNGAVPGAPHCIDQKDENGNPFCFRRSMGVPDHKKQEFCIGSHAEKNAVAQAAREGISVKGASLYVTVSPCFDCMKMLAVAQIRHVYFELPYGSENKVRDQFWEQQGKQMFETFEPLVVSQNTLKLISQMMEYPTSKRRLNE
ncbi:deoxycytidylate deaminase [Desulfonema magnum]|uniref:CMP/dCMP deaminase zinc-binding n=1 Tax=Desulfonema magnum TaxID=45655 RepID=A0A975GKP4_9BACT|nr:dCMP deaminase family protein [Desulfonema magnum]QTA84735.1 CMP/dCMP deaminase zinc-binding [Desulfonema magnum]